MPYIESKLKKTQKIIKGTEIQQLKLYQAYAFNFSQHTTKNSPFYGIILLPDKELIQFKWRCFISV